MIEYHLIMTLTEIKPITVQVLDLQQGETVSSANVNHVPPSGSAITIEPTVETPYINMLFGPFGLKGIHVIKVQAVGSGGSKPEVLYFIDVRDA